ncbi:MAG: hypothetical protein LBG87_05385 [Spirochaetaceae bacterium]|nr:hypothetical protein [Spirochaetaceae bacterium]
MEAGTESTGPAGRTRLAPRRLTLSRRVQPPAGSQEAEREYYSCSRCDDMIRQRNLKLGGGGGGKD